MTDKHLSEFMELDWENAAKDSGDNPLHSQRSYDLALRDLERVNEILQSSSYKPGLTEMMRNGRESNGSEDEEGDEVMSVSSCTDDEVPGVSSYDDDRESGSFAEPNDREGDPQSGPSARKTPKISFARRNNLQDKNRPSFGDEAGPTIKKRNFDSARERMYEGDEDCRSTSTFEHWSKLSLDGQRKKKLALLTAQIKKRKRNANIRRAANMRGKGTKGRRTRKRLSQGSENEDKFDGKRNETSRNHETKVDGSVANEGNVNAKGEDLKKSVIAGKEEEKAGQNGVKNGSNGTGPPKTGKDHGKGDCGLGGTPKEHDISNYEDVCEDEAMVCGIREPLGLCAAKEVRRHSFGKKGKQRGCRGSRKRDRKQGRRSKRRIAPFIKFYLTVYKELCGTTPVTAIAKEAGKRWNNMSCEEKLKYYPKKFR